MISILAVTTTSTWLTVIAGSTVVSGLVSVFVTQFFRKGEFRRDQRLRLRAYATCIGAFYTAIQSVDQVASAAALGTAGAQVAAEADKNYVTANRDLNDAEAMVRLVGKRKVYATLAWEIFVRSFPRPAITPPPPAKQSTRRATGSGAWPISGG